MTYGGYGSIVRFFFGQKRWGEEVLRVRGVIKIAVCVGVGDVAGETEWRDVGGGGGVEKVGV